MTMHELSSDQILKRRMALAAAAVAVVGGGACATAVTMANSSKSTTAIKPSGIAISDEIVAYGRPDAELESKLGVKSVAFLGRQHTYLLIEGGDELLGFAQLDPTRLMLMPDGQQQYVSKDNVIWGALRFRYLPGTEGFTAQERELLKRLQFIPIDTYWAKRVSIKGRVLDAVDVSSGQLPDMVKPRKIVFFFPPATETTPNLGAIALLPLAVAVDVVTAPLQLLGGAAFLLVTGARR